MIQIIEYRTVGKLFILKTKKKKKNGTFHLRVDTGVCFLNQVVAHTMITEVVETRI